MSSPLFLSLPRFHWTAKSFVSTGHFWNANEVPLNVVHWFGYVGQSLEIFNFASSLDLKYMSV